MKVWHEMHFAAPPAAVFRALTSPDTVLAMFRSLGHAEVRVVDQSHAHGLTSLRTRREVPTVVPAFAARFFSPRNVVEQHDEWDSELADGSWRGTWQVTTRGVPVTVGGVQRLVPHGDGGTLWQVEGEVVSPMPTVGARLAELVVRDLERTLNEQRRFLVALFAGSVDQSCGRTT